MSARKVAAEVLLRVWSDDAYAAPALSFALNHSGLEARDRGLCTELLYGVLRTEPYLERRLLELGKLKASDSFLRAQLFVAAYQIEFLDRIPERAAVFEAVQLVNAERGKAVSGFANGILRALIRSEAHRQTPLAQAIFQSTPSFLRKRLARDVGEEETLALLAPTEAPRPWLRLGANKEAPAWFSDHCRAHAQVPAAYLYDGGGDPRARQGFEEGVFSVQELGAQVVALAAGVTSGQRVLDVCAGRGQKTFLLCDAVGKEGTVCATDLHEHKVSALKEEAVRNGHQVEARPWDWTQAPPEDWRASFDHVIVDAPCSGVGTLRRRPEISRRLKADDPARLAELQFTIAMNAALALRAGGTMLFATCSVLREEGEEVVARICEAAGMSLFVPQTSVDAFIARGEEVPAQFRLLPQSHSTDGYFVARLIRNGS